MCKNIDFEAEPFNNVTKSSGALRTDVMFHCKNIDFGRSLWSNVVLIGGSSVYDGMAQRLANELSPLTAQSLPVKVIPAGKPKDQKIASWLGGSILGSLSVNEIKMTKEDYVEHGATYVNECCP